MIIITLLILRINLIVVPILLHLSPAPRSPSACCKHRCFDTTCGKPVWSLPRTPMFCEVLELPLPPSPRPPSPPPPGPSQDPWLAELLGLCPAPWSSSFAALALSGACEGRLIDGAKRKGARYAVALLDLVATRMGSFCLPLSEVDLPRRLTRLITEALAPRCGHHLHSRPPPASVLEASEEFAFGRQADAHEALMLLISRWLAGCVKAQRREFTSS